MKNLWLLLASLTVASVVSVAQDNPAPTLDPQAPVKEAQAQLKTDRATLDADRKAAKVACGNGNAKSSGCTTAKATVKTDKNKLKQAQKAEHEQHQSGGGNGGH